MQVRSSETYAQLCHQAARLNYFESVQWTDFPQLGCWHSFRLSESEAVLAHSAFVPNQFFGEGLVENYARWSLARAQWMRTILKPDEPNLTMREILKARLGK
jgi:hypothetical protein